MGAHKLQVVGGVAVENGEVLCILHGERGGWEIVGGKVEPGESIRAALLREYPEETGREIETIEELLSYEPDRRTPTGVEFELWIYRVTLKPGVNKPGPEVREVAWRPAEVLRDGSLPRDYAPALAAVTLVKFHLDLTKSLDAGAAFDPYPVRTLLATSLTATLRRALGPVASQARG